MYIRRFELIAIFVTMLFFSTLFSTWLVSGKAFGVAWATPLRQNVAAVDATTIPGTFSYQGTLRDANGELLNGTVNLSLKLYGAVTGGTPLYTEEFTDVNVRDGLFTVVVGDAQSLPISVFDTFPLYLGVSVNNDAEMLPRQRFHPVPYAMQASSAQNAVTANNLAPGGGVPGSVALGSGGGKQITFPDGGKITDSASGMTLSGGGADKTVTVEGGWSARAIRDIGDSNGGPNQRSIYPVSMNRYVVEAPDQGTAPDTVPVDPQILSDYCGDEDGCSVSLYMRSWSQNNAPGLLAGVSGYRMALAAPVNGKRQWSMHSPIANGVLGTDNDGTVAHLINIYNACFFTDGEYLNGQGNGDSTGFGLLNWYGTHDFSGMTCVLIIED